MLRNQTEKDLKSRKQTEAVPILDFRYLPSLSTALSDFFLPAQAVSHDRFFEKGMGDLLLQTSPAFWRSLRQDLLTIFPQRTTTASENTTSAFGEKFLKDSLRSKGVWLGDDKAVLFLARLAKCCDLALSQVNRNQCIPYDSRNFCGGSPTVAKLVDLVFSAASKSAAKIALFDEVQCINALRLITKDQAKQFILEMIDLCAVYNNGECQWRCEVESLSAIFPADKNVKLCTTPHAALKNLWNYSCAVFNLDIDNYCSRIASDPVEAEREKARSFVKKWLSETLNQGNEKNL